MDRQPTPGPFTIEQNDAEGIYLVSNTGTILCEQVHTAEDARLIAAAPALLSLLQEAWTEHAPCDRADCWCREALTVLDTARGATV